MIKLSILFVCLVILSLSLVTSVESQQPPDFAISISGTVADVAWNPTTQQLAVATSQGVKLYSNSLVLIETLPGYTGQVFSISWHPGGNRLVATGSDSSQILIWTRSSTTSAFAAPLIVSDPDLPTYMVTVAWSPDGTKIATLTSESDISLGVLISRYSIWDAVTFQRTRQFEVYFDYVYPRVLSWSPDSQYIVGGGSAACLETLGQGSCVAGSGPLAFIADVNTGSVIYSISAPTEPNSILWLHNNQIAIGGYKLKIYNNSVLIKQFDGNIIADLAQIPGTNLLVHGYNVSEIVIRDLSTGSIVGTYNTSSQINAIGVNSTGTLLASGQSDGGLAIWDISTLPSVQGTATVTAIATFPATATQQPITPTSTPLPPANKLVFSSALTGSSSQLFTINLDGSGLLQLPQITGAAESPMWSPDGQKIVFTRQDTLNDPKEIFTSTLGGTRVNILPSEITSSFDPSWSPDGQRVVFTSERNGNRDIYWVVADGTLSALGQLTDDSGEEFPSDDSQPDWSPVISSEYPIVFVSDKNGDSNLYLSSLLGANEFKITNTSGVKSHPTWSPDGSRIAYLSTNINNGRSHLNIINADGTGDLPLSIPVKDVPFDWSPDGTQIVFVSPENHIKIVEVDSYDQRTILSDGEEKYGVSWSLGQPNVLITERETLTCNFNVPSGNVSELINAIIAGNSALGTYVICLAQNSTYTLTSVHSGTFFDLASSGLPNLYGDIIIQGNNSTIERAPTAPEMRIFTIYSSSLEIRDLTLRNAQVSSRGAALYVRYDTNVLLYNINIQFNSAAGWGGGIYKEDGDASIVNSNIHNNSASDGGGIYNFGRLFVQGTSFRGNQGQRGGGLVNNEFAYLIEDVFYENNATVSGGAISTIRFGTIEGSTTSIKDSCIFDNRSASGIAGIAAQENRIVDAQSNWWGSLDGPSGVGGGSGDAISDYVIYDEFLVNTPPACSAELSGFVELQGRENASNVELEVKFEQNDTFIGEQIVTTDATGNFVVQDIPWGNDYRIWVKHARYLANDLLLDIDDDTVNAEFGELRGGDADDSNTVVLTDFSILAATFGKAYGQLDYDERADFNGDNMVTLPDFSLLAANFGQAGDPDPEQSVARIDLLSSGTVDITLNPDTTTVNIGQEFDVTVRVEAGTQTVDAAATYLTFDPTYLTVVSRTPGSSLPTTLTNSRNNTTGTVNFAAGALEDFPTGTFDLVTIRFRALAATPSTGINYVNDDPLRESLVAYAGESVLNATEPAGVTIVDPNLIFQDGFESGNLSAWSSSTTDGGDLSVNTSAALVGTYGVQAVLDDNNSIYVTDSTPNAETRYRARFSFDPNSITMPAGNSHVLLATQTGGNQTRRAIEIMLNRIGSAGTGYSYQIQARTQNDGGTYSATTSTTITDSSHIIEALWVKATAVGANNGSLTLWIDGVQVGTVTGIDNDQRTVETVQLGAVEGVDTGTRGTYYFDNFESRRD